MLELLAYQARDHRSSSFVGNISTYQMTAKDLRSLGPTSSLSDLTALSACGRVGDRNSVGRSARHEQLPPDRPRHGLPASALGERVVARAASGAVRRRGGGRSRPVGDEPELPRFGVGPVPPFGAGRPSGLRLRVGRVFQSAARAGHLRQRRVSLRGVEPASRPRHDRVVPTALPSADRGPVRRSAAGGAGDGPADSSARSGSTGPRSTPTPAATAPCRGTTPTGSRRS